MPFTSCKGHFLCLLFCNDLKMRLLICKKKAKLFINPHNVEKKRFFACYLLL